MLNQIIDNYMKKKDIEKQILELQLDPHLDHIIDVLSEQLFLEEADR